MSTYTPITEHTVTDAQIRALRQEALTAGDLDMVDVCDDALNSRSNGMADAGDTRYLREVARVINDARAQES